MEKKPETNNIPARWNTDDVGKLLERIESHPDASINKPYMKILKKIDWDAIRFGPYSNTDCKLLGEKLILRARRFRKLNEVIAEIKTSYDLMLKKVFVPPKKPKTPLARFIDHKIGTKKYSDKNDLKEAREKYKQKYENLPENKKQKYVDQYEEDMKAYQKQFDHFIENTPTAEGLQKVKKRKRQLKAARPPPAPKSPYSAVQLYVSSKISKLEIKDENTRKSLRRDYTLLPDKKKFRWIRKAKEDQERYEKEIAEYKAAYPDAIIKRPKPNISDKENLKYENRVLGRPIPPARSAYLVFCGESMAAIDQVADPKSNLKDAVSRWRDMKPDEKKEYDRRHLDSVADYIEAMRKYLANASPEDRLRIETREVKTTPEYWSKVLKRLKAAETKSVVKEEKSTKDEKP